MFVFTKGSDIMIHVPHISNFVVNMCVYIRGKKG